MELPLIALTASNALPVDTGRLLSQEMFDQCIGAIEVPFFQYPEYRKRLYRQLPHRTAQKLTMYNGMNMITG